MESIRVRKIIVGDPQKIWKLLSHPQYFTHWLPRVTNVQFLDGAREGLGSTWHITKETDIGYQELDQECTTWQENKQIAWHDQRSFIDHHAMTQMTNVQTIITLSPHALGTMVEIVCHWEPVGIAGKFLSKMYLKKNTEKMFDDALVNLSMLV